MVSGQMVAIHLPVPVKDYATAVVTYRPMRPVRKYIPLADYALTPDMAIVDANLVMDIEIAVCVCSVELGRGDFPGSLSFPAGFRGYL